MKTDDNIFDHPVGTVEVVYGARQLRDTTGDALNALENANSYPVLFVRGQTLARIGSDEENRPVIEVVREHELRARLAEVTNSIRFNKKGDAVDCSPARDAVQNILAQGVWGFPPLRGIIEGPALRPDGTVIEVPGYDAATRLFYAPPAGFEMPPISCSPTKEDVADAKQLIDEALCDFPFSDDSDESDGTSKTNAVALLLTPVLRPAIAGHVPLALIDAPQAGNGKGLLAQVVCVIATGRQRSVATAPVNEEEWRKKITSSLITGAYIIIIDNNERPLESPDLASVLTTESWEDRILGASKNVILPVRVTFLVTGNNIQLSGDLPRRCYWIRIDAKSSRPWQRVGFKHPELLKWVTENRAALLAALLTIARAWFVADKPAPKKLTPMGSFEEWSGMVGGILDYAGWHGFLGNLDEMYGAANQGEDQWLNFLEKLEATYGKAKFTVKEIHELGLDSPVRKSLPDDVEFDDRKEGNFQRILGRAFSKREGRRYGAQGICIKRRNEASSSLSWKIEKDPLTAP